MNEWFIDQLDTSQLHIRNFNTADQRVVFQEAKSLWTEEPFLNASNYHS
jgi:hypothetical protein